MLPPNGDRKALFGLKPSTIILHPAKATRREQLETGSVERGLGTSMSHAEESKTAPGCGRRNGDLRRGMSASTILGDKVEFLAETKILIVEDEFLVADDIARYFAGLGASILGPVSTVAEARSLVERADAAVLDIDLHGASVFPIADRLSERGIPFVFFSAYDRNVIPSRLDHVANLMKPADRRKIIAALFPDKDPQRRLEDPLDVITLLPKLRLAARLMLPDARAADRLIEMTLELAIRDVADRPVGISTEQWLNSILKRVASNSAGLLH